MIPKMLDPMLRQMLYPAPEIAVPETPPTPLLQADLRSPTGETISAWAHRGSAGRPRVLFFHGNGENLATLDMGGFYRNLIDLDVSFLAVDYPGYGRSEGEASEPALVAAAEAGLAWSRRELPAGPQVVLGWSLGAAVAMQLSRRHEGSIDSLILLSPWDSLAAVAAVHYPSWIVRLGMGKGSDTYDSAQAANRLELPTVVIHGQEDQIIPIHHGRALVGSFPITPRFLEIPGVGHNDLLAQPEVWEEIRQAFERSMGV
jgi:pimeloyl-ACP methyl ester carboxylesterase